MDVSFEENGCSIFSQRTLFNVWRKDSVTSNRTNFLYYYLMKNLHLDDCEDSIRSSLKNSVDNLCVHLKDRWQKSHCSLNNFVLKHSNWLQEEITLSDEVLNAVAIRQPGSSTSTSTGQRGRPKMIFMESGDRSKKRKVESLVKGASLEELTFATQVSLRSAGRKDAAEIVKQLNISPKRATRIKTAFRRKASLPVQLSPEEALAVYVDGKFTKKQYLLLSNIGKLQNANIYPAYEKLLNAKRSCYPENIKITEISAEINLQSLLNHTLWRLTSAKFKDFEDFRESTSPFTMISKWGCDGASGHSTYKQKFVEEGDEKFDDSSLFVIFLLPLLLKNEEQKLWQNPHPSSTRYCRPIKLIFKKESADLIREEVKKVENQIGKLTVTKVSIRGREYLVKHELVLTMVDGKVCNILAGQQSSQTCYICGAKPREMNDLKNHTTKVINETNFRFGLSSLHAWIRCFECLLHISYRLEIKKWQVKKDDKEKFQARKQIIQGRFRKEMGLLVDIPKQGTGTTNDGNTARRFVSNPSLASSITGIEKELIERLGIILKVIASGFEIDGMAFEMYALDTAKIYTRFYSCYYMPASFHKLLIHGRQIIDYVILPIGQLSEEAQEARNKDCKRYREHHSRKFSRRQTMEDLIHMLLITSDPVISERRNLLTKKNEHLPQEAYNLLHKKALDKKTLEHASIEEQDDAKTDDEDDDKEENYYLDSSDDSE